MAVMGGWKLFTRNGGRGEGGWVAFMMGDVKFLKSLYIVGRGGANTPTL